MAFACHKKAGEYWTLQLDKQTEVSGKKLWEFFLTQNQKQRENPSPEYGEKNHNRLIPVLMLLN